MESEEWQNETYHITEVIFHVDRVGDYYFNNILLMVFLVPGLCIWKFHRAGMCELETCGACQRNLQSSNSNSLPSELVGFKVPRPHPSSPHLVFQIDGIAGSHPTLLRCHRNDYLASLQVHRWRKALLDFRRIEMILWYPMTLVPKRTLCEVQPCLWLASWSGQGWSNVLCGGCYVLTRSFFHTRSFWHEDIFTSEIETFGTFSFLGNQRHNKFMQILNQEPLRN